MTQDTKKTDKNEEKSKFSQFTDKAKQWWKKFLKWAAKWVIVSMLAIWWSKAKEWYKWEFKKYAPKEIINDQTQVKIDPKWTIKMLVYKHLEANFEWKTIENIISIFSTNGWYVAYDSKSYVNFLDIVNKDVFKKFKPEEFSSYWFFGEDAEVWLKNWHKICFHLVIPPCKTTQLHFLVEIENWDIVEYIKEIDLFVDEESQNQESTKKDANNQNQESIENKTEQFEKVITWDDTVKYFNFNHLPTKANTMYFGLQLELNEKENLEILEIKSLLWSYLTVLWKDDNIMYIDYHTPEQPDTIVIIWKNKDWKKIKIEKQLEYKE